MDRDYHNAVGNALCEAHDPSRAIEAYRRAIEIDPNFAEAWNNLGNALGDAGQLDEAIEAYRTALRLSPNLDRTYSNLGVALRDKGQFLLAIAALEKAIEFNPNSAIAWDNLGIALRESGSIERAIDAHERAILYDPHSAIACSNFSIALRVAGRLDDAIAAARLAISIRPDYAEAHNNLGAAMADQGRTVEAIVAYRIALKFRPAYADAYTNLGASFADKGEFSGSLALCRKVVEIEPANAHAHFNLAISLLLHGDFQNGFAEYEWRWRCPGLLPRREFSQAKWDGRELHGRTILVHAEQGFGDVIQFVRYVPLIAGRGGRVVLECQPELLRFFRNLAGVETIITSRDPQPPFDVHCPIASLPGMFTTTAASIPNDTPYITSDPILVGNWREKVAGVTTRNYRYPDTHRSFKIGIAWAGKPAHPNDRNRSLSLTQLLPLLAVDADFYSLQMGSASSQAAFLGIETSLIDLTAGLTDFAETAGLIANLDMVISADTAVAHLAGAMGKRAWVFIPFNPDWRWLLERDDSPWYPTMRLFRQRESGNWEEPVNRMMHELGALVAGSCGVDIRP